MRITKLDINRRNERTNFLRAFSLLVISILLVLSLAACSNKNPAVTPSATSVSTTSAVISTTTASSTTAVATTTSAATNQNDLLGQANNAANAIEKVVAAPPTASSISDSQTSANTTNSSTPTASTAISADQQESNTVVGVVQNVSPAVVTVYNKVAQSQVSSGNDPFGNGGGNNGQGGNGQGGNGNSQGGSSSNGFVTQGIGSGVIIDKQGYIVTNAHVVEGAQQVQVAYNDGKQLVTAKVVGSDQLGDIAVLKVDGTVPAVATLGDSSKVQVGETVVAIGSALGNFRNSASKGIVSGLNRTVDELQSTDVYIQTDAPINHGNSGGPLVDLNGQVIGINTAVLRSTSGTGGNSNDVAEGLGFAIPSNTVKYIVNQLIQTGTVTRPYFGITYEMISPAIAGTEYAGESVPAVEGAWVHGNNNQSGVVAGGPADQAGLKDNDVITAIDSTTLDDNHPLVSVLQNYKPGDTIKLTVQRGNQTLTLSLTLGSRPKGQ